MTLRPAAIDNGPTALTASLDRIRALCLGAGWSNYHDSRFSRLVVAAMNFARRLEQAGIPREHADALAKAIDDNIMELLRDEAAKAYAAQRSNLPGRPSDQLVRNRRSLMDLTQYEPWKVVLVGMSIGAAAILIPITLTLLVFGHR